MNISVIIPCYNVAAYLERAVDSVLAQTLLPAEIILVDDGSTDSLTPELAKQLAAGHPEMIRYVHQKNRGLSGARNTGMREARGEWIALLDADDWWMPTKLAAQAALIEGPLQPDLVCTALMIQPEDGSPPYPLAHNLDDIYNKLRWSNRMTPSSVILRRDMALDVGGFDERLRAAEDWEMWMRLLIRKKIRIADVREPLTCYRLGVSNMSNEIQRMIDAEKMVLESTLVSDLRGFQKWCWTRRIWAGIYIRAAMNARAAGDPRELMFVLRSLAAWPSPFFFGQRYFTLAVTLRRRLLPHSPPAPAA